MPPSSVPKDCKSVILSVIDNGFQLLPMCLLHVTEEEI